MATDIVGSLFGVNPTAYQLAQQKQAYNQDYQAVQLDPLQQANLALRQGGRGLGQLAGGLMGMEDPELAKASQIKQIASQFDLSSPDGLRQFSSAIRSFAPAEAIKAAQVADERELTQAQTTKALREKELTPTQKAANALWNRFLADANGDEQQAGLMYQSYLDSQKLKNSAASASKLIVEGQKNVLKVDEKAAERLQGIIDTSENVLPRLQEQASALRKGIAAGTFSDARVAFNTALSTLGIKDKATLDMLKNTKTFNTNRIELATSVAKQLGVNPTDRDFQASLNRFASAGDAPEVSAAFLEDMIKIQQGRYNQAVTGLDYYRKNNGSFGGYTRPLPSSPIVEADPFAGKSLDELKKLRDSLKNKSK